MFSGASNFVELVDSAFFYIVAISVLILVAVTFLMIYFVIKYSRKRHPKAVNIHGSVPLEVAWTIIPTILVLGMFWFGWIGYKEMSNPPADAMVVDVTAMMWKWQFNYDNGLQTDTLYVPLNKAVRLNLNSLDVNHSFFIPAFRVKKDVIPNRNHFVWFRAVELGSYDIACTEYCGLNHWAMYTKVVVMPEDEYYRFIEEAAKAGAAQEGTGMAQPGSGTPDELNEVDATSNQTGDTLNNGQNGNNDQNSQQNRNNNGNQRNN
jgi:cytochrome c oxidase subunit II